MDYLKTAWETLKPILAYILIVVITFTLLYGLVYFLGINTTGIVVGSLAGVILIIQFIHNVIINTKIKRRIESGY